MITNRVADSLAVRVLVLLVFVNSGGFATASCSPGGTDSSELSDSQQMREVLVAMQTAFGDNDRQIAHAKRVLACAERILSVTDAEGDLLTVQVAAILHDIGRAKAGTTDHERDGAVLTREMLAKLKIDPHFADHVARIVDAHHSAQGIDTPEFRVIWIADQLVNQQRDVPDDAKLAEEYARESEALNQLISANRAQPKGNATVSPPIPDVLAQLTSHLGRAPALVVAVCGGERCELDAVVELVERTCWTVFCCVEQGAQGDAIRNWAREQGYLGHRIYVVADEERSPVLADGMADGVWALSRASEAAEQREMLRVLRPGGIAVAAGTMFVKPGEEGVDEWRHPYHGPDNNVVSRDRLAGLPGELRFQTRPVFAAMPNQSLFAGGRIFFFTGHIAFHEREEPLLNTLTVLNAYNGLKLWSRPLDPSCVVHNFTKLANDREVVYAEGGTLKILDASTGGVRAEVAVPAEAAAADDTDWKWIVQDGDRLWAAFGPPDGRVAPHRQKRQMGHWPWDVADAQYRVIVNNFGTARRLAAFTYPEMKLVWSVHEPEPFDVRGLCLEGGRIFLLAPGAYVSARSASTGDELWRRDRTSGAELLDAIGDALKRQGWGLGWATYCCARAHDGVVCVAGPPFRKTIGIGFDAGNLLWTSEYESPHPFFHDGLLYLVPRVAHPEAVCRQLDPVTGRVVGEFGLGVIGSCTRLTVTPRQLFYRPGGGEGRTVYYDFAEQKLADYEGVVRPGCFDGVVPANGRLYWMPLACDCWQVHGTFAMAPRVPAQERRAGRAPRTPWASPGDETPAAPDDWPMFRADPAGTATVPARIPRNVQQRWTRRLPGGELTAPICAAGRVLVAGSDGTVHALSVDDGSSLWQASSQAAVPFPPVYWNGRVVFGSCDGALYCLNSADGRLLGREQLAPATRFVNIMNRFMSAWPIGGGVIIGGDGVAYAAAGSTAADGAEVAAIEVATGEIRWRQSYTLDRDEPRISFGVQGNILLKDRVLFVNGGAPTGIVALDALTGGNPQVVARLEAGMEMFLEPTNQPWCTGPELYANEWTRTTIFKRHQGRAYFSLADRTVALIDGRLFCARDVTALDSLVDLMNKDPVTGGSLAAAAAPRDVMHVPVDRLLWAGPSGDVCGVAVGTDGLVVLRTDRVDGISAGGQVLWSVMLPAPPVRWGLALTGRECLVTLSDGQVLCLANE